MRFLQAIGISLLLLVAGCSTTGPTSSYDASNNRTTYESGDVDVAQLDAAVGSGSSIVLRAMASCKRQGCTPEAVRLVFDVKGQGQSAIADRSLSITADGSEYSWQNGGEWDRQSDVSFSSGSVVRVRLPLSSVQDIATASSVSATLGTIPLTLEGRPQSRLRAFVQLLQDPSTAGAS